MIKHPPQLVNGIRILEEMEILEDIDLSVQGKGKVYEDIVQELSLRPINRRDMYFEGISWENMDLLSGDVTALIPYYAYRMRLWYNFNEGQVILTEILNKMVKDERLRDIILEEVYEE